MTASSAAAHTQHNLSRLIFIEELSRQIGKAVTTIRTCSSNEKFQHLIPRPFKLPNSRRLCWWEEEVIEWINRATPASPPPSRRRRGRPTKREQLERARWAENQAGGAS